MNPNEMCAAEVGGMVPVVKLSFAPVHINPLDSLDADLGLDTARITASNAHCDGVMSMHQHLGRSKPMRQAAAAVSS